MSPTDLNPWISLVVSIAAAAASFGAAMNRLSRIEGENKELRDRLESMETAHSVKMGGLYDKLNEMGNRLVKMETILERMDKQK